MLGNLSRDRNNNLNLIRMVAASAVLIGHAWPLSLGPDAATSIPGLFSSTAVLIFFGISGFLVTQSMDRTSAVENWLSARALRLFPGLLVALLLTVLILGPAVTKLPLASYFSSPEIISYFVRNFTLAFMQYGLPGVFENNPYPIAINGSLWTLFYEVVCYSVVFLFGFLALKRAIGAKLIFFGVLFGVYATVHVLGAYEHAPYKAEALMKLGFPFFVGMTFYVWRDKLPMNWFLGVALFCLTFLFKEFFFYKEVYLITLTYWVFLIGYLPKGRILSYNNIGDYSYGTYIYAFPIQQASVYFFDISSPWVNIAIAFPITLLCATLSWYLVEKPCLKHKSTFAAALTALTLPLKRALQLR